MKVLYVGDNRCRPNFGCRATSMALADIIKRKNTIISTISGAITEKYDPVLYKGDYAHIRTPRVKRYWKKFKNKLFPNTRGQRDEANFVSENVQESVSNFLKIYLKYPPLNDIMHSLQDADSVVVNGEGGFLFRSIFPYEAYFEMFVFALAQSMGKKTFLLNAMFSDGTYSERNEHALEECRSILTKCTLVTARDTLSLKYYLDNIGDNAIYMPDALFSWDKYSDYLSLAAEFPLAGVQFPDEEQLWSDFDFSQPYIVVSAGSRNFRPFEEADKEAFKQLIASLSASYRVVLQSTSEAESKMLKEIAKELNLKFIDCRTNILFGMSVLANAQCYVSGRWHPSILASLGGTPCVMMESNSHKSRAIYTELEYNENEKIYNNPPLDEEIDEIMLRIHDAMKIDRTKILETAKQKSVLCLKQYSKLLK